MMFVLEEKKDCTGCGACANRCPKNAIRMVPDHEGFLYPRIDESLCIECNLCRKVCPQLNTVQFLNPSPQIFLGGVVSDLETLLNSSSGGAFSAICDCFPDDTIICGSCFSDNLEVKHCCITKKEGLAPFRKSKYLQSKTVDVYPEIKKYLADGMTVLFSGTPCQVAGLYSYLSNLDKTRLYTIDLICHGVPSQYVFDKYIESIKKKYKMNIGNYSFREKRHFLDDWEIDISFGNDKRRKYFAWGQDPYMYGFLKGIFYRPCCYSCHYAQSEIRRPADLTIGDFWGIGEVAPEFNEKKGSSLIIGNSQKGLEVIKLLENKMSLIPVSRDIAIKENHNLFEPSKHNPNRSDFFIQIEKGKDFFAIINGYQKGKPKAHSQKIRVIITKLFPGILKKRRAKVISAKNNI